jgi:hypothetical protein
MRSPENDFDDLTPPTPREARMIEHLHDHGQKLVQARYGLADTHSDNPHIPGAPPFFDTPTVPETLLPQYRTVEQDRDYAASVRESIFADGDAARESAAARVRASQEPLRAYVDKAGRMQIEPAWGPMIERYHALVDLSFRQQLTEAEATEFNRLADAIDAEEKRNTTARLPSRGEVLGGPRHTYELSNEQEDAPDLFATARYWQDVIDGVFRLARTLRMIAYGAGVVGFFALGVWAILKVLHKL